MPKQKTRQHKIDTHVWLSQATWVQLTTMADQEHRSVTGHIEHIIIKYLETQKPPEPSEGQA